MVECKTYRFRGHHEGDPKRGEMYRTRQEIEEWEKRDPIPRLANKLIEERKATEAELNAIVQETLQEMEDAVAFAKQGPAPKPEDATSYLFVS